MARDRRPGGAAAGAEGIRPQDDRAGALGRSRRQGRCRFRAPGAGLPDRDRRRRREERVRLEGVRVLLVGEEPIIAMTAEDMLEEIGCRVVASAAGLTDALAAAEADGFDIALLDINLNGVDSFPVAARLRADGRPFVF